MLPWRVGLYDISTGEPTRLMQPRKGSRVPRTTLCRTQTWLLALEPHVSAAKVPPRAPGPSSSDLWESPWLTHDSHKSPTVQGFPELQALDQSPTELLTAAPSHCSDKEAKVPSPLLACPSSLARIPHSWRQI